MERNKKIKKVQKKTTLLKVKNNEVEKCEIEEPTINPYTQQLYSQKYYKILKQRKKLPAYKAREKFMELIKRNNVVVIEGETGSGKTTQIPQFLLDLNLPGVIGVTQPRRIAAISVAKRVSDETDTEIGNEIGYSVRFNECSSELTRMKYLTDGMLIRELISDRDLNNYSVIILDEAHERSLNTDILISILKELIVKRNGTDYPLKLVIMSATIETDRFVKFFNDEAPVLTIPGRQHGVEIFHSAEPKEDYLSASIETAVDLHLTKGEGDILIFLTGEGEIEEAVSKIGFQISANKNFKPFEVLPLYGALSSKNQQLVFKKVPHGTRKIIVSTNIAETSLTIDGVVYVIDSGLSKQKIYNPRMKFESLLVSSISKANAKQRAGRAGRTKPGECYRLYTKQSYEKELVDHPIPEVLRSELSSTILSLSMLGHNNIVEFDFMEPPSTETAMRALETLVHIGAIDEETIELTPLGRILGLFPLEPRMAVVLLNSKELDCSEEVLNCISIMSSGNWRIRPPKDATSADLAHKQFYSENECDFFTNSTVLKAFEDEPNFNREKFCWDYFLNYRTLNSALKVKKQLKDILNKKKCENPHFRNKFSNLNVKNKVKICFLSGFYQQVAYLYHKKMYKVFNEDHSVLIHPSSSVSNRVDWVVYIEFVLTKRNYIRTISRIDPKWLILLYPDVFNSDVITKTESRKKIMQVEKHMILKY